jgi:hypothetical protein
MSSIRSRRTWFLPALTLVLALSATPASQAGVIYQITVDTSGVSGSSGYVDLQFNPADPSNSPSATATVSNFTGYTGSLGSPTTDGSVSGSLTSTLTLGNSTALNAYLSSITFGATLQFLVSLNGPAFSQTAVDGSSFAFSLYNNSNPLQPLNGSSDPTAVLLNLVPTGVSPGVTIDVVTGPAFNGGPNAQVTAVPEASTTVMGLLVVAGGAVAAWRRRTRHWDSA